MIAPLAAVLMLAGLVAMNWASGRSAGSPGVASWAVLSHPCAGPWDPPDDGKAYVICARVPQDSDHMTPGVDPSGGTQIDVPFIERYYTAEELHLNSEDYVMGVNGTPAPNAPTR